jgi:hypothetical protein
MGTTVKGAPQVEEAGDPGAKKEQQVSPRDQRMAELIEARKAEQRADAEQAGLEQDQARAAGADDGHDDAAAPSGEGQTADAAAEADTQTPGAPAPAPLYYERDGKKYVKLKVYGKEQEVTLEEAIKRAQKDGAADARLQQAVEAERQAQQQMAQAAALQRQLQQRLAQIQAQPQSQTGPDDGKELEAALKSLYEGDLDGAKQMFSKVLQGRREATPAAVINPEQIANTVHQRLRAEQLAAQQQQYQKELIDAARTFEQEFPEIAQDPRWSQYADKETEIILAEDPTLPPLEVMRRAGRKVAELIAPANQTAARQLRKQSRPAPVSGLSGRASMGDPPPKPKTTADVINEMRRSRGQTVT